MKPSSRSPYPRIDPIVFDALADGMTEVEILIEYSTLSGARVTPCAWRQIGGQEGL